MCDHQVRGERGQTLGIWVLVIGLVSLMLIGLAHETATAHTHARVQAVADLVALAAVHDTAAAEAVARRAGARVTDIVARDDGIVTVTVELDGVIGTASARPDDRPE